MSIKTKIAEEFEMIEAKLAAEVSSNLSGMNFEGNNYKLTKWFSLPTHLSAAITKIEALETLIEAARDYDKQPDDGGFEAPHPVFMLAQENDDLRAETKRLKLIITGYQAKA